MSYIYKDKLRRTLLDMEWEPFLSYVVPEIVHYELSSAQFAQRTARSLLRRIEVQNSNEAVFIQPTFVSCGEPLPPRRTESMSTGILMQRGDEMGGHSGKIEPGFPAPVAPRRGVD